MARERPDALANYHEFVWYDLFFGGGHPLRAVRDRLSGMMFGSDDQRDLEEHDVFWIDYMLTAAEEDIWPALLEDDPAQPLEQWWWHLGAIRRREYPAERLPGHLRAVYSAGRTEAL